jgi:spore coat polysaccharide biosynthesis protein SpsF (cytidylyltransferase family)
MRTVAVIPARMDSERLPGKVMVQILGKPLLGHLLDRVCRCTSLDDVVVATSTNAENDVIESYCNERDVAVFRGSEEDVLDRVLQALVWCEAEVGVLVFGDGPLIDSAIIDQAVTFFHTHEEYNFVGNDLSTSWPPGMEIEVFRVSALADSALRCKDPVIREHGTLYMRQHPEIYNLYNLEATGTLRRPELSFEVDVAEDLEIIRAILTEFSRRSNVSLGEIIGFMDNHPELGARRRNVTRRWKKYRENWKN